MIFFVTSACLCCYLNYYFLFASVQPHLKIVRSTSIIVCWQQTEMSFLFFNPVKKGWNSSTPPLGLPRDTPPLPHNLYGRTDRWTDGHSYVQWRHNQIFSAWWVTNFSYPWCFAGALCVLKLRYRSYSSGQDRRFLKIHFIQILFPSRLRIKFLTHWKWWELGALSHISDRVNRTMVNTLTCK